MESYIVVTGYNKCLKENPKLENDVVKRIFNHYIRIPILDIEYYNLILYYLSNEIDQ